jgi:hypothetical protein
VSIVTKGPEAIRQRIIWRTDVITSRNGSEQRIALRIVPRQQFSVGYLADSDEEVQYWKFELVRNLDSSWTLPLWAESEKITMAVTAGDNTVDADFSLMDDAFSLIFLILHPNGETYEVFSISGRSATTATRLAGTFSDDFPLGSVLIPIESSFVQNNSGYSPLRNNAARLTVDFVSKTNRTLEAKGADPLTVYNTRVVLEKCPLDEASKQIFSQNLERLDFGGKIQIKSVQSFANIDNGRSYTSLGKLDRQNWKAFLDAVRGQQKSFYTPTYRHDMTVLTQPSVGGLTFIVDDEANAAGGWENIESHLHLAIETADGDTQYKEMDLTTTVDNLDGTHTVGLTTGLTATVDGSTINKVSFLELCRLGSDTVEIDHFHTHRIVKLPLRTIQQ